MQTRKLLIVDDELEVLNILRDVFMHEGYEIETATSGQEALRKMEVFPAEIVLSDYMMPGMDGIELLKKIKQCYPHIIPILLTGRGDLTVSLKAINQGEIFRLLLKPWDNEELKMTIHTSLQYYDLILENEKLAKTVKRQDFLLEEIEKKYPGITEINKEEDGRISIEDEDSSDIINPFPIREEDYSK
jgi:DNA-binding NtrC family response regulator